MKKNSLLPLWSTCLGNFFEHYGTGLFGFLSPFLAPLIFPKQEYITALILTYAMIPLGMLARPLGAIVFGYIGDRYGRRQSLFLTMGGMALVSGCIAFTPTFQQAGIIAPLIFCAGRLLENFLAAGESMGGAIFILEHAPNKKHDVLSGLFCATTAGGILFASAGVSFFSYYNAIDWGWRVLYLIGCLTGVFGCIIRMKIPSDYMCHVSTKNSFSLTNLLTLFWKFRFTLFLIVVCAGFGYACYVIPLVLMNGFIPLISNTTNAEMMALNTFLLIIDLLAMLFFGWLASKISREKVMLYASVAIVVSGIPLCMLLEGASLIIILAVRMVFVFLGVAFFAPFHAWAQHLVPKEHRYLIISFGYAVGSQLLGGPTAAFSLWIFKNTGFVSSIAWYWLALAFGSCYAIIKSMQMKQINYETQYTYQ